MKLSSLKLSLVLLFLASVFACSPEATDTSDSFTVSGYVPGLDTKHMSYSYRNAEGKRVSDSVFVKDNKFTYTGKISEPTHIIFWPNVEGKRSKGQAEGITQPNLLNLLF